MKVWFAEFYGYAGESSGFKFYVASDYHDAYVQALTDESRMTGTYDFDIYEITVDGYEIIARETDES